MFTDDVCYCTLVFIVLFMIVIHTLLLTLLFCFIDISPPSIFHIPADHEPDKQLIDWLKEQGADADTIDKV